MADLTLILLAAGMGSRYGGLKQLEGFGPGGETLMDYAVFDAVRAGFRRAVFVIRRDFEAPFREQVASKYERALAVELAFQSLDDLPAGFALPEGRVKPWGTGHALRAARGAVDGPFAVSNADDFYGRDGYAAAARWLAATGEGRACVVTYPLGATLSPHGTVSRGVCQVREGRLVGVRERLRLAPGEGAALDLDAPEAERRLPLDTPVSLNLFGFHPGFLRRLDEGFGQFCRGLSDPLKGEYQLPGQVNRGAAEGWLSVDALAEGRRWFGVTYPEDKPTVKAALAELVRTGDYPERLFP